MPKTMSLNCAAVKTIECVLRTVTAEFTHPDVNQSLSQPLKCNTMYGHTYSKSMDQLDKVANPARDQLNRKNEYFPVPVHA